MTRTDALEAVFELLIKGVPELEARLEIAGAVVAFGNVIVDELNTHWRGLLSQAAKNGDGSYS